MDNHEKWDPMREDFECSEFNSYDTGPGKNLPGGGGRPRQTMGSNPSPSEVQLYVRGIPLSMTEKGIRNLFSRDGEVIKVKKCTPKMQTGDTFGFVTYRTTREAESAVRNLNNFHLENRFHLQVQIAESREDRAKRQARMHTPDFGRDISFKETDDEGAVSSAPENSARGSRRTPGRICTSCGKTGTLRCSQCRKTYYCSKDCQTNDWLTHKTTCVKKSAAVSTPEARVPSKAAAAAAGPVSPLLSLGRGTMVSPRLQQVGGMSKARRLKIADLGQAQFSYSQYEEVAIICVISPNDFWISKISEKEKLENLQKLLMETYNNTTHGGYVPEKGEVCSCKYSADNEWYRAVVHEIQLDAKLRVTYIDFGNGDEVLAANIRKLQSGPLTQLPAQAIHCCLDIEPKDGGQWGEEPLQLCAALMNPANNQLFRAKCLSQTADLSHISLLKAQDGKDICDFFIQQGCTKLSKNTTPVKVETSQSDRYSPAQHLVPEASRQDIMQKDVPQSNATSQQSADVKKVSQMDNSTSNLSVGGIVMAPKIPQPPQPTSGRTLTKGQIIQVQVQQVDTPEQMWMTVLDIEALTELEKTQQLLQDYYNKKKQNRSGFSPTGNMLYAALFSSDKQWYRAQVYDYNTSCASVIFLDYGNREKVDLLHLYSLVSDFQTLPFQAVRCSLSGISHMGNDGWTKDSCTALKMMLSQQPKFKAQVLDVDENDKVSIELSGEGNTSLNEELIKKGHAVKKVSSSKMATQSITIPSQDIENGTYEATVVVANQANDFTALLVKDVEKLAEIEAYLSANTSHVGGHVPKTGDFVISQFSQDKAWYRALVLDQNSPDTFTVKFVDYGNKDRVKTGYIERMPDVLCKYPPLALCCSLADLPAGHVWDPNCLKPGVMQKLQVKGCKDGVYQVDLYEKDATTGLIESLKKVESSPILASSLKKNDIIIGQEYSALITEADEMKTFTTQLYNQADEETLQKIFQGPGKIYETYTNGYQPKQGELVACLSEVFATWYRAEVISCEPKYKYQVKFLDFGGTELLGYHNIAPIQAVLAELPLFAVPCCLADVELAPGKTWKADYLPVLEKCTANVVERKNDVYQVKVINAAKEDVCDNLVTKGILLRKSAQPATSNARGIEPLVSLPLHTVTSGGKPQVVVMHVNGPDDFYAQVIADLQSYVSLSEELLSHYGKLADSSYLPRTSEIVAGFYLKDNAWYRCQVMESPKENRVLVKFIEFGNTDYIPLTKVFKLEPCFTKLPPQAINFSLTPPGATKEFSLGVRKRFQLFSESQPAVFEITVAGVAASHVVNVSQMSPIVDLASGQTDKDIWSTMEKEGLIQLTPKMSQPDLAKHGISPGSLNVGVVNNNVTVTVPKAPVSEPLVSLPVQTINSGDKPQVVIMHVNGPDDFYAQVIADLQSYVSLSEELLSHYGKLADSSYVPRTSEIVAGFYLKDNAWYRCQVMESPKENTVLVKFIEFGNTDYISLTKVYKLEPCFTKLPPQAINFSLILPGAIKEFSSQVRKRFQLFSESQPAVFEVTVADVAVVSHVVSVSQMSPIVDLASGQTDKDIWSTMEKEGLIQVTPKTAQADLAKYGISPGSLNVVVVHVNGPDDFFVQIVESLQEYATLAEQIAAHYNDKTSTSFTPQVSDVVAGFYEKDKAWYRCDVQAAPNAGQVKVRFIDYGNEDVIQLNKVLKLESQFQELSPQAVPCKLSLPKGVMQWSAEAKDAFKKLSQPQPPLFVIGVSTVHKHFLEVDTMTPIIDFAEGLLGNDIICEVTQTNAQSIVPTDVQIPATVVAAAQTPLVTVLDLPTPVTTTDSVLGVIVHNNGPDEFYIHMVDAAEAYGTMLAQLHSHYKSPNVALYQPHVGELVAAYYTKDSAWYRCEVCLLSQKDGTASVKFIEFGNVDTVELSQIRKLDHQFLKLSPQGAKCRFMLQDSASIKQVSLGNSFSELLKSTSCFILTVSGVKDRVLQVTDMTPIDLNTNEAGVSLISTIKNEVAAPLKLCDMPAAFVPKNGELVKVCHIDDPSNFYVQQASEESKLNLLLQAINEHCNECSEAYKPAAGESVLALFSDIWFRAGVKDIDEKSGTFRVQYVDYGNSSSVEPEAMRKMVPKFFEMPCAAIKCGLPGAGKWSENADNWLKQKCLNRTFLLDTSSAPKNNDIYTVDLIHGKSQKRASEVMAGLDPPVVCDVPSQTAHTPVSEKSKPVQVPTKTSVAAASKPLSNGDSVIMPGVGYTLDDLVPRKLKPVFKARLVDITDPANFFVSLGKEDEPTLSVLTEEIKLCCEGVPPVPSFHPKVGDICCAQFSGDGQWFRALVRSHPSPTEVEVLYIDYGNSETRQLTDLRLPSIELLDAPAMALSCSLCGVKAVGDVWSTDALTTFVQLCYDQDLTLSTVSLKNKTYIVKITNQDGLDVADQLIQAGMAATATQATNSELSTPQSTPVKPSADTPELVELKLENQKMKTEMEELKQLVMQMQKHMINK